MKKVYRNINSFHTSFGLTVSSVTCAAAKGCHDCTFVLTSNCHTINCDLIVFYALHFRRRNHKLHRTDVTIKCTKKITDGKLARRAVVIKDNSSISSPASEASLHTFNHM